MYIQWKFQIPNILATSVIKFDLLILFSLAIFLKKIVSFLNLVLFQIKMTSRKKQVYLSKLFEYL